MRAAAVSLLVALTLAGCAGESVCDVDVDGAKLLLAFARAPPMADLGTALVEAGWNVTEGATELAATKGFPTLEAPPERQAIHLALMRPAGVANVTTAQVSSHVAAPDAAAAERALGPVAADVLATLRPHLGEPMETIHDPC